MSGKISVFGHTRGSGVLKEVRRNVEARDGLQCFSPYCQSGRDAIADTFGVTVKGTTDCRRCARLGGDLTGITAAWRETGEGGKPFEAGHIAPFLYGGIYGLHFDFVAYHSGESAWSALDLESTRLWLESAGLPEWEVEYRVSDDYQPDLDLYNVVCQCNVCNNAAGEDSLIPQDAIKAMFLRNRDRTLARGMRLWVSDAFRDRAPGWRKYTKRVP